MIKKTLKWIRFAIVRCKFFAYRASLYANLVQMSMVVLIFIMSLNDRGYNITKPMIGMIFLGLVLIVIIFGYSEYKFEFLAEEQGFIWSNVPQITELLTEVKELRKEVQELKQAK